MKTTEMNNQENSLGAMTERWMQLERKTNEQRKKAEAFYEKNLMKLIEEDFVRRNKDMIFEDVNYMIMSVGTSYEPLVLNIQLLKPKKVLFLCTEKTEKYLDKIVAYCHLQISGFQKTIVSETNPEDVYQEIKKAYLKWNKPEKLYIDFTGGTKAMSAAAAMAGAMIDVQLIYVGSDEYLTDFRKPKPGSETLYYIENPLAVFGDLEIEKAFALFEKHNYSGARERLENLKENVPDPDMRQQLNFVYLLACVYEQWDALDFVGAYKSIMQLSKEIARDKRTHRKFLLMDMEERINAQKSILMPLSEIPELIQNKKNMDILSNQKYMIPLMFSMCQNALIREEQEKLDMATLLLYRLLEMIEQCRLAHYNLYVSKMNYLAITPDTDKHPEYKGADSKDILEIVKNSYFKIKQSLFGKNTSNYMPDQISLLEGFILLLALDDDISKLKNGNHADKLKRIRSMVYLRNNSIFAHGLGPVSSGDFQKFKLFVLELFMEFCILEKIDFNDYMKKITWINPLDSINYAGMEDK